MFLSLSALRRKAQRKVTLSILSQPLQPQQRQPTTTTTTTPKLTTIPQRSFHNPTSIRRSFLPHPTTKPSSRPHTHTRPSKHIPILTTPRRNFASEYERPFSLYRGTLDAFLIGSRRNYVRPSVTHAAGLGNTSLRHIRLHPEDYIHSIPAHRALPQYLVKMIEKRPGVYMSMGLILLLSVVVEDYRRTNELYDTAMDSIFALKAKNFLIKQGERIFLETILIMLHEGVLLSLEQNGETQEQADARFVAEVQGMLAEIERHRDFRLSNIPLNILEVLQEQENNSIWYQLQILLHKPLFEPMHHAMAQEMGDGVEFDTPWDIIRHQRALIEPQENQRNFETQLDSAGVGAVYGLFYPLITRYHHMPTELSVQAVPKSMQYSIRHGIAPMSKLVGRVRDRLQGSVLYDQFQESHRNEEFGNDPERPNRYHVTRRRELPEYWNSDVDAEIYNSYYLQRAMNLIKQCRDVDGKVSWSYFGENSKKQFIQTYLSKAHQILLDRQFKSQLDTFSAGDSHIFRYYYKRYNLVPYLNSLQYEMSELILLRQRLMKLGRAVGIEPEIESLSNDVLHLLDPYDTKPKSTLRDLTIQKPDGTVITLNAKTTKADEQYAGTIDQTLLASHPTQLNHHKPSNPIDVSLVAPGGSMSFQSTSNLNDSFVELHDGMGDISRYSRYAPQLPIAITPTVSSLYQPVKIHNLVESIMENQHNIKGLNVLVDSLHHAQFTDTPQLYPCLGVHPPPISQEKYYIRSMFNPLQNAFGITKEEKYVRGLLGCVDLTLMRNAAEYQRWLHLVPVDRNTLWDVVQETVMRFTGLDLPSLLPRPAAGREEGYLDRYKLSSELKQTYDGTWKPYITQDATEQEIFRKPTYYSTQVEEESWGDWIYRAMGWDSSSSTHKDYIDKAQKIYGDDITIKESDVSMGSSATNATEYIGSESKMRNTNDYV